MNRKYETQSKNGSIIISNNSSEYDLVIENPTTPMKFDLGYAHFRIPAPHGQLPNGLLMKYKIPVTGRELVDYPKGISKLELSQRFQYLEVGAGLGEFIPNLVRNLNGNSPKPIVIDPANYQQMQEILVYAIQNIEVPSFVKTFLEELLERNNLITNPQRVNLINARLGEAVERHPELVGCADIVVDSCGPYGYSESEILVDDLKHPHSLRNRTQHRVNRLERQLLKPNGRFFFFE